MPAVTVSLEEMLQLGDRIAQDYFRAGWIAGFQGSLGAGKTTLSRSILGSLGFSQTLITSPTFSYLHVYDPPREDLPSVYHFDLYRMTEASFLQLGFPEYLEDPKGVSLIEWSERLQERSPEKMQTFEMRMVGEDRRRVTW